MQTKPLNSGPPPRRGFGPGEVAAIVLLLGLVVFAILFAPTPASGKADSAASIARIYPTMGRLVEAAGMPKNDADKNSPLFMSASSRHLVARIMW